MEKEILKEKRLSARALIECARKCAADRGCMGCHFCEDDRCTEALLLMLSERLEAVTERWIPFKAAKPAEDGEYLVMIVGATQPTTLWYDPEEEMFFEEDTELEAVYYPVTHWAELPEGPNGTPSADGYTSSDGFAATFPSRGRLSGENTGKVRRCATCRHEDRLGDEERCIECEKHNLWEERR